MEHKEKKLDRNYTCCFKQILEATSHKTAAVWLLASYLITHPNKTNKIWWTLVEKPGQIHKFSFRLSTKGHTSFRRLAKIFIYKLCADTGCLPEDVPRVMMVSRDRWWERIKGICVISTTWFIYIYIYIYTKKFMNWCFYIEKCNEFLLLTLSNCLHNI